VCRGFTLVCFVFFASSLAWSQDSLKIKSFENKQKRIYKIMAEPKGSLEYLKVVYRQIEEISEVDENAFALLTEKYNEYVFNERILYIQDMNKLHELERALVSLAILEQEYPENKQVKELGVITKQTTTERLKKNLKESKTAFTIEPYVSIFTLGKPLNEFAFFKFPGVNLMFGAGIFKTFNVHEASRNAFKKRYTYSQIGIKLDYFSGESESENIALKYVNPQISFLFNRSIGCDLGYALISNSTLPVDNGLVSFNISKEFAFDFLSAGINARVLSDFDEVNQIQYGLSLKYTFKLGNKLTQSDLDGIQKSIETISLK
jgi:hypothetical protein